MLIPVLLFIVGLLCLIKGGDWFVDGATGIARRFHVPELLIGATVVSIGTHRRTRRDHRCARDRNACRYGRLRHRPGEHQAVC